MLRRNGIRSHSPIEGLDFSAAASRDDGLGHGGPLDCRFVTLISYLPRNPHLKAPKNPHLKKGETNEGSTVGLDPIDSLCVARLCQAQVRTAGAVRQGLVEGGPVCLLHSQRQGTALG